MESIAPFAGRLADRLGARPLTVGGMSLVAIGLFALGALRPATPGFLALLALIGIGLGCFTPPNNASIMGSVPEQQSGLASGVLNMTRGMGTALGLALTGLVFDLAGGTSPDSRHRGPRLFFDRMVLGSRGPSRRSALSRTANYGTDEAKDFPLRNRVYGPGGTQRTACA